MYFENLGWNWGFFLEFYVDLGNFLEAQGFKETLLYSSTTMSQDMSKNYASQQDASGPIVDFNKKIIYSLNMKTSRNELLRRLLSGVTKEKLEYLVKNREEAKSSIHPLSAGEARRPIPAPRRIVPQYGPVPAPRMN